MCSVSEQFYAFKTVVLRGKLWRMITNGCHFTNKILLPGNKIIKVRGTEIKISTWNQEMATEAKINTTVPLGTCIKNMKLSF